MLSGLEVYFCSFSGSSCSSWPGSSSFILPSHRFLPRIGVWGLDSYTGLYKTVQRNCGVKRFHPTAGEAVCSGQPDSLVMFGLGPVN